MRNVRLEASGLSRLFRICSDVCTVKLCLFPVVFFHRKNTSTPPGTTVFSSRVFLCVSPCGLEGTCDVTRGRVSAGAPERLLCFPAIAGERVSPASKEQAPAGQTAPSDEELLARVQKKDHDAVGIL